MFFSYFHTLLNTFFFFQNQSGITYYAPQTQPPPRPILSQRRHKNAIPIMAPPERSNKNSHGIRSGGSGHHSGSGSNDSNNNSDQQQVNFVGVLLKTKKFD